MSTKSLIWWVARMAVLLMSIALVSGAGALEAPAAAPVQGSGTSTDKPADKPADKPHDNSFVIGNDDVLAINVWKEPDISRSIPVRSDGKISLPLVGEVQAAGLTPLTLEKDKEKGI